MVVTVSKSCM